MPRTSVSTFAEEKNEQTGMSAIFILIGCSLLVALGFLIAFIISLKKGQYDDNYTPSVRMLFDNEKSENNNKNN